MKIIATAFAAIVLTLGTASTAAARDHHHHEEDTRSTIVITGRDRWGAPIYSERYLARYTRKGTPVWEYRPVAGRGGYDRGRDYCEPSRGDRGGYGRDDDRRYDRGGYSGDRVSFEARFFR